MIRKFLRSLVYFVLLLCLGLGLFYAWVRREVLEATSEYLYTDQANLPEAPVAIVLGAEVYPNDIPSQALAHRLDKGIDLYKDDKVKKLLMSGDGRSIYYNEVETMKEYAQALGVPNSAILLDEYGLRTYESCARAKSEYNLEKVIVVTQRDHLMRAVYTCRKLGIDAQGMVAQEFDGTGRLHYLLREQAALLLAWIEVNLFHF